MERRNEGQGNKAERLLGFTFKNKNDQEEELVIRNEPPMTDGSPGKKGEATIKFVRCGKPVYVSSTERTGREKRCIIL